MCLLYLCVCVWSFTLHTYSACDYVSHVHMPSYVPASLSLCVSIYQLLPHTDAGVGLGGGWWGALQWLHSCLLLGESLHRGRLHSQSRRCRKLPGQWGGRARRWADARVLHGSFLDWFLNGVVVCRTWKQVAGVICSPPALCLSRRASALCRGQLAATPLHRGALRSN